MKDSNGIICTVVVLYNTLNCDYTRNCGSSRNIIATRYDRAPDFKRGLIKSVI